MYRKERSQIHRKQLAPSSRKWLSSPFEWISRGSIFRFSEPVICNSRAVFKWLSKVIPWLRLLRLVIGLKDSRQFFNQWDAKPKPIAPCTLDLSRASSELHVIARNCDWFIAWLVGVIALVLVFRQSFENRSISFILIWVHSVSLKLHKEVVLMCKWTEPLGRNPEPMKSITSLWNFQWWTKALA